MNSPQPLRRVPCRDGFTIVEIIIALMILSVGLLALVGVSSSVVMLTGSGARQTLAASVADARIERIQATPCASMTSGADTTRGIRTTWTSTAVPRAVDVAVTVRFNSRNGEQVRSYRTYVPC